MADKTTTEFNHRLYLAIFKAFIDYKIALRDVHTAATVFDSFRAELQETFAATGLNLDGAIFQRISLQFINLNAFSLRDANFMLCNLSNSNLTNADLSGAQLSGAKLLFSKISGANLSNTCLEQANLRGLNFEKVNLTGADLTNADLGMADLTQAIGLHEITKYDGVKFNARTKIPDNAPDWMQDLLRAASREGVDYAVWKDGAAVARTYAQDQAEEAAVKTGTQPTPATPAATGQTQGTDTGRMP